LSRLGHDAGPRAAGAFLGIPTSSGGGPTGRTTGSRGGAFLFFFFFFLFFFLGGSTSQGRTGRGGQPGGQPWGGGRDRDPGLVGRRALVLYARSGYGPQGGFMLFRAPISGAVVFQRFSLCLVPPFASRFMTGGDGRGKRGGARRWRSCLDARCRDLDVHRTSRTRASGCSPGWVRLGSGRPASGLRAWDDARQAAGAPARLWAPRRGPGLKLGWAVGVLRLGASLARLVAARTGTLGSPSPRRAIFLAGRRSVGRGGSR